MYETYLRGKESIRGRGKTIASAMRNLGRKIGVSNLGYETPISASGNNEIMWASATSYKKGAECANVVGIVIIYDLSKRPRN